MSVTFGVHTGPANTTVDELRALWRRIEDLPFDWISIWDHFYAADGRSTNCLDAVVAHTALAMDTERVRCGSLVYCAGYRHPGVLANAIAGIDQLSGGRVDVGVGAGWLGDEYRAYGIPYPSAGRRLDLLEEHVRCLRGLLRGEPFSYEGEFFTLTDAVVDPRPVQAEVPIWIGGGGERRTLKIVAELADGWNVPFIGPDDYARKREVLAGHCDAIGRDPAEVRCSVNVGCAPDEASLHRQFGDIAEFVRPGVLMGSTDRMVDAIGRYVDAGAVQVNLALRAPFEVAALDHLAAAVDQLAGTTGRG
ncbi:LLM class flavin-dependent oxidoreductase [Dermatobacter hominis]|uniref:LLM class flavin-dependent oxidoreductase n=1 Tax=Dermatobacter hominis TaxID=2884263 RepID=UPI001D1067AE|nr:LLM class flavin-dependent oxidoreductase [Dermatobacter hominis]UDY36913.1 LLM class flavin-dependent oxidoreductase [Dermatobacter hominis]